MEEFNFDSTALRLVWNGESGEASPKQNAGDTATQVWERFDRRAWLMELRYGRELFLINRFLQMRHYQ